MSEVFCVRKPSSSIFPATPFICTIRTVPHEESRQIRCSTLRIMNFAGFSEPVIEKTGVRHAMLALALGLWELRRESTSLNHIVTKAARTLRPVIGLLAPIDKLPRSLRESTLRVGMTAIADKPT